MNQFFAQGYTRNKWEQRVASLDSLASQVAQW